MVSYIDDFKLMMLVLLLSLPLVLLIRTSRRDQVPTAAPAAAGED
jgi:hypothetical protein